MANLRSVIEEREQAKSALLTGASNKIPGQITEDFKGEVKWTRYREMPIPKDDQPDHLKEYAFNHTHPDGTLEHPEVREWQLRKEEVKHAETDEFYKRLGKKWEGYRLANPNDNIGEKPPKWWLQLDHNKPEFNDGMWVKNMPIYSRAHQKQRITVNAPGNPNI